MMTPDLLPGVELGIAFVNRVAPDLDYIKHEYCAACDAAHEQSARQFAHTYHKPSVICWARAASDLPVEHQLGILMHEYGHLLAGDKSCEFEDEKAADLAVLDRFGIEITYVGPHEMQWVELGAIS